MSSGSLKIYLVGQVKIGLEIFKFPVKTVDFGHHKNSWKISQDLLCYVATRERLERVQLPVKIARFGGHKNSLKCPQVPFKNTWFCWDKIGWKSSNFLWKQRVLVTTKPAGNVPRSCSNLPRHHVLLPQERLKRVQFLVKIACFGGHKNSLKGCLKKHLVLVTGKWLAMVRLPVKYSRLWWPQKRL